MNGLAGITRRAITSFRSHFTLQNTVNKEVTTGGIRQFSVTQNSNMKLLQFTYNTKPEKVRVGYLENNNVVDINKLDPSLPCTLLDILRSGNVRKVSQMATSKAKETVPLSSVTLKAPIHGIDKILCVGLNYKDHCEEQNLKPPEVPMIFSKFGSCITGPEEAVKLRTDVTNKVDWEVELVVVIGKEACFVKAADAYKYVLGYTVAQDISARDWQKTRNGGQFLLGKAMDTFCPIGPYIVTHDEVRDPQLLDIKCSINGTLKQSSNTCQLVHKIPDVIERLSSVLTLCPGDIILTGTPGGVGMYRNPPEYLKPGDVIVSEIQNIGVLNTKIVKF